MPLDNFSQRRHHFFVLNELHSDYESSLYIVLQLVQPIFLHALVEGLKRFFQVALNKIEEGLFLFAAKVEPNSVCVAKGAACRNDQLCYIDQELEVQGLIPRVQFQGVGDLQFYFFNLTLGMTN